MKRLAYGFQTPGGSPLATYTVCRYFFAQARGGTYSTQNPQHNDNDGFCHFGQEERVLYLNFDVCRIDLDGEKGHVRATTRLIYGRTIAL